MRTSRLTAERLQAEHLEELVVLHSNPPVMATLGGVRTAEASAEYLAANLRYWAKHQFGIRMFRDGAGNFVGRGGIRHAIIDGVDEIELAYALLPEYWRQGLATEIAQASITTANQSGIRELVAFTLTTNVASRCVMRKVGFLFEKEFVHHNQPHILYRYQIRLMP